MSLFKRSIVNQQNGEGKIHHKQIDTSLVLPGLSIDTIITALNLSKEQDQLQIGKWLMSEFQG